MKCGVWNHHSYDIPFTGKHEPNKLTCSQLCELSRLEHCTGIAEVMGLNPVESPEFFRFMRRLLKLSSKCEDHIFIWFRWILLKQLFLSPSSTWVEVKLSIYLSIIGPSSYLFDHTRILFPTYKVRITFIGKLRVRKPNTNREVTLDAVPERRTKQCSPRFRPSDRFCELSFRYLSPGSVGEECRPLDLM